MSYLFVAPLIPAQSRLSAPGSPREFGLCTCMQNSAGNEQTMSIAAKTHVIYVNILS